MKNLCNIVNTKANEKMTTTINKLKIGDRLSDTLRSQFGYYTNRIVDSIRTTKSGRFVITISSQYVNNDGSIDEVQDRNLLFNGAVVGHTEINLHK